MSTFYPFKMTNYKLITLLKLYMPIVLLAGFFNEPIIAQPQPGDVFREYVWIPEMAEGEAGKFLRVGGRLGYQTNKDHFPVHRHQNGHIPLGKYILLDNAIKAELGLEKICSHEDTKGLRVSINGNPSIKVPSVKGIPEPEADYMHHTHPIVSIPLDQINEGWNNTFRLDVDTVQRWNWPQNLIYGVVLRIYYAPNIINTKTAVIGISSGDKLGASVTLEINNPNQSIRKVDYIGLYEGINYEGDGIYRQWHYHHFRKQLMHHIGSTNVYPYSIEWNTSWLPDQEEEIKVAAWIVDNTGLNYFTGPVEGLTLERDYKVELCKPYDQPKNWVTRSGEFESKIDIAGNPANIVETRMYWTSWSPCYCNGIYINDVKVFDKEGPCYEYMAHEVPLENVSMLNNGTNIIKTGKEPLHDGQMVHGMEVQWPGIMMLIKYR